MLFKKKSPKNEYEKFKYIVQKEYQVFGIEFKYSNHFVSKENPKETPDHYSIFAYWVANKIKDISDSKILDVGNSKVANLFNSINHDVTALVLEEPVDDISEVNWTIQDISKNLNFIDDSFDIFTSPSTLHLIGQGRYGDEKNPLALIKFIKELKRVMRQDSKMYLMLPLGEDQLLYGFHFIYSLDTIKKMFSDWVLVDYMVDNEVKFGFDKYHKAKSDRFDQDIDVSDFKIGQYKIIYLEFIKK